MFEDQHRDAFKAAAEATLARIRRDRARAPEALKTVFTIVADRLFDPSLSGTAVWKDAGIKDRAWTAVFRVFTQTSLSRYIAGARIEVAHVLILITDLNLTAISLRVGYTYRSTFTDNYKRLKGKLPSEVPRELLPPPLIADVTSLKVGRGLVDEAKAALYVKDLLRIYPEAAKSISWVTGDADPEPR